MRVADDTGLGSRSIASTLKNGIVHARAAQDILRFRKARRRVGRRADYDAGIANDSAIGVERHGHAERWPVVR